MDAHSFFRNMKLLGDFAIRTALCDADQNLSLARSEFNRGRAFGKAVQRQAWQIAKVPVDGLNGVDQFLSTGIFCEIAHGA